jgi:diaminopimelate epimerase
MKIQFTKMSGAGNDFVVVDNRNGIISDAAAFALKVCDRRFGIGADGVLLLENNEQASFTMKYYNADGTNAGMCGNGGRCLAKFAYDMGIPGAEEFTFEAFGYIYHASRLDQNTFELRMKEPFGIKSHQQISLQEKLIIGNYINTGTDHSVVFLDENAGLGPLQITDVFGIGKALRNHAVYQPMGTNVNFVSKLDSNSIEIRTYERGVEDETLACGTGSVASALLSSRQFEMESPINVKVKSGEFLTISFQKSDQGFSDVRLKGSAVVTFTGEIQL